MSPRLLLVAVTALLVGIAAAFTIFPEARELLVPRTGTKVAGKAAVGGPFSLVDHTGKAVSDSDYRGRFMLVFFGYTHCPDVCPSGLQTMSAALDKLGAKAAQIQPLFITLDPARDTPEQLSLYVQSFNPRIVGLTGSAEDVAKAAKAYRVYYKRVEDPQSAASYTFDHSSYMYLMDTNGEFVAPFPHAMNVDRLAQQLEKVL